MDTSLLVHTCSIKTRLKKQRQDYIQGTSAFTEGETVTGAVSGATATVDELVLLTGSWAGGDATGYLVLSDIVGTFQDSEAITSIGGAAVTNGANADYQTAGREYLYYDQATTGVRCRFATSSRRLVVGDPGQYVKRPTKLFLPPGALIVEDDSVTTTTPGFSGTYRVKGVYQQYADGPAPDHIECDLAAIP